MNSYSPANQMILTGQLSSVVVGDWSVRFVVQDSSSQLDVEALADLQGKVVRVLLMSADALPNQMAG